MHLDVVLKLCLLCLFWWKQIQDFWSPVTLCFLISWFFLLVVASLVFSDTFMDGIFALILFCWGFQLKVSATCKSATEGCPLLFVFSKGAKRSSWELGSFSSEASWVGEFSFSWVVHSSLSSKWSSSVLQGVSFLESIPNTTFSYAELCIYVPVQSYVNVFLVCCSFRTEHHATYKTLIPLPQNV